MYVSSVIQAINWVIANPALSSTVLYCVSCVQGQYPIIVRMVHIYTYVSLHLTAYLVPVSCLGNCDNCTETKRRYNMVVVIFVQGPCYQINTLHCEDPCTMTRLNMLCTVISPSEVIGVVATMSKMEVVYVVLGFELQHR